MILVFVMARQKREARLRARCPGHPRLSCLSAAKTWMPGTRPGMTSFARLEALFHWLHFRSGSQDDGLFFGALFLDFFAVFFFLGTWLLVAAFFAATFAALRAFGCFFTAARRAAASAARAQPVNSSGSPRRQLPVRVDHDGLGPGLVLKRLRSLGFELRNGLIVGTEIETGPQRHCEV